jgi:hypothetical protein
MDSQTWTDDIVQAIQNSGVSQSSKKVYIVHLKKLVTLADGKDIFTVIKNHIKTIKRLREKYVNRNYSLQTHAAAVMAAFKYHEALKDRLKRPLLVWTEFLAEVQQPIKARALSGLPTDRQGAGWIPLHEIVRKRFELPFGSPERLLIAMYTDIPSRRNDFATSRLYDKVPPRGTPGNYIVLPRSITSPSTLVMQEYKTAKRYNVVEEVLPDVLVNEIRESLRLNPRVHLFVAPKTGKPYTNETVFNAWANATLKAVFGKPLTLTLIRHAYITNMSFDTMTPMERQDLARKMGHGVAMQDMYKFRFDRVKGPDPTSCSCVCVPK